MPLYDAQCNNCEAQFEFSSSIERCRDVPNCGLCGATARRVILHAPMGFVKGKFDAFVSMVDGSTINNQKDLAEHNKRNNVVNINDGYSEEAVTSGAYAKQSIDKVDKKEIVKEIHESVAMLEAGYVPPPVGHVDENNDISIPD